MELNEIGFKFVRKCINYIETNGKGSNQTLMPAAFMSVSCPVGGDVESGSSQGSKMSLFVILVILCYFDLT